MTETEKRERFTPGPWRTLVGDSIVRVRAGGPRDIAATTSKAYWQRHDDEDMANAHLIAAAPDLYEALVAAEAKIREWSGGGETDFRAILQAALAKARGETTEGSHG